MPENNISPSSSYKDDVEENLAKLNEMMAGMKAWEAQRQEKMQKSQKSSLEYKLDEKQRKLENLQDTKDRKLREIDRRLEDVKIEQSTYLEKINFEKFEKELKEKVQALEVEIKQTQSEVDELKAIHDKAQKEMEELTIENEKLMDDPDNFLALVEKNKLLREIYDDWQTKYEKKRDGEVAIWNEKYFENAVKRQEVQKVVVEIITMIDAKSKDSDLINKIFELGNECQNKTNEEMEKLEKELAEVEEQ